MNPANPASKSPPPQPFWTLTRIGLVASAIVLIAAVATALLRTEEAPPAVTSGTDAPSAKIITAAPAAARPPAGPVVLSPTLLGASFNTIDGKSKKLADYAGKIVVVDLWATWCGPCRQEIPHLIEIAKQYKSKGVEVLGLTTEDPEAAAELVKDFSKQFKINYPVGYADPQMQFGLMNGRNGIPQTLILGRDGKVLNHFVGFSAPISVPQMKTALDQAVAAG